MISKVCALVAAALSIGGCSDTVASPPRGALPPGTAVLTVAGKNLGTTDAVRCERIDWMTRIHTPLVNAMLSSADRLRAEFVRFHDADGFTGSYEDQFQGEATVTMTGPTYHITGAALGFNKAERTRLQAETFSVNVSC